MLLKKQVRYIFDLRYKILYKEVYHKFKKYAKKKCTKSDKKNEEFLVKNTTIFFEKTLEKSPKLLYNASVVTRQTMKWEIATGVKVGNFHGECPIRETGRQVTVHFA